MADPSSLLSALASIVGPEHVLAGDEDRAFYSQDIYAQAAHRVALAVRPGTVEELAATVAAITGAGHAVLPRGGGASYTGGYLPERAEAVCVDTRRLDRVVEVDAGDMYVVVEAGCTWKSLAAALRGKGLRTPFWGPLSGAVSTVGGSLSQNSILWGSARYGVSAESVLGLQVVLADGTLLRTGSWAGRKAEPFFRHHGPDLTGIFLGDTGALGVKARATLRLIPEPAAFATASFGYASAEDLAEAMAAVARSGLASECFGMDPVLQRQRMKRTSLAKDVKALGGVLTSSRSLVGGVKEAARVVLAGRSFLDDVAYSLHVGVEGPTEAVTDALLAEVRGLCLRRGREVENTIPKVLRGDPFVSMTSGIGPEGERWAPVHGLLPLSEAAAVWARLRALLAEHAEAMERLGVVVGVLTATVGTTAFVLEPVFYWPGPRPLIYDRLLEPADLARLKDFPPSPEAASLVAEMRRRVLDLFVESGAAHLQIGKTYPYRQTRQEEAWRLLEAVKAAVDPRRLMNPGSLGLE
jgi:FAD/FMN-containing dehydrogenase